MLEQRSIRMLGSCSRQAGDKEEEEGRRTADEMVWVKIETECVWSLWEMDVVKR